MLKATRNLYALILSALLMSCSSIDSSTEGAAFLFFSTDSAESEKEISAVIRESDKSLLICAPFINDPEIVDAIILKHSDSTEIEVVLDSLSLDLPGTKKLINNRVPVHARAADALMNSFFIVSDGRKIVTGSFDLKAVSGKQICSVAVFNDKTMADNYRREFYILKTGQSPLSKDSEFDLKLGPMGAEYEPGWYSDNQIFLDDGSIKGMWGEDEIQIPGSAVETYFIPYQLSNRSYADYSLNENGTYTRSAVNCAYTDYETDSTVIEDRIDFINSVLPMIRSAEASIRVFSSALTEKAIIYEIIRAKSRGVKIEIYLDYDMTLNLREQNSSALKTLLSNADAMFLCRPDSDGSLSMNLIQIDYTEYVISSAGFTRKSLTGNDASVLIIRNNRVLDHEIQKAVTAIMAYSIRYNPESDYTGKYDICDYKERL